MSFGFSTGDFIAAASLIKDIISALSGAATSDYRELKLELHGLQRALYEIEHLEPFPGREAEVNGVKAAALVCQYPLEEFQVKLRRFRSLSENSHVKKFDVKNWGRKVQWNFCMPDEMQKLRAYIAVHTGSLNMRLTNLGLATMVMANAEAEQVGQSIQATLKFQRAMISEDNGRLKCLYMLVSRQVVPQLQNLVELATKVWASNLQIMNHVARLHNMSMEVDVKHTWFQHPMKLEDAFGRNIPIPAEYSWSTIQAVIRDQFSSGPGHEKVQADEYELFCTEDSSQLITAETASLLMPGSNITMAMLIGVYIYMEDICPKPACKSRNFLKSSAGGMVCNKCKIWFGLSKKKLPRPFPWVCFEEPEEQKCSDESKTSKKRKRPTESLVHAERNFFKEMREQRKWFKNLRINYTELSGAMDGLYQQLEQSQPAQPKRAKINLPTTAIIRGRDTGPSNQKSQKPPASPETLTSDWAAVLQILVDELSIEEHDLKDTMMFTEIGLDSLLLMSIASRMRKQLSLNVRVSALIKCLTVKDLRSYIESGCTVVPGF